MIVGTGYSSVNTPPAMKIIDSVPIQVKTNLDDCSEANTCLRKYHNRAVVPRVNIGTAIRLMSGQVLGT
jgi:hypothetical protein